MNVELLYALAAELEQVGLGDETDECERLQAQDIFLVLEELDSQGVDLSPLMKEDS